MACAVGVCDCSLGADWSGNLAAFESASSAAVAYDAEDLVDLPL